MSGEYHPEDHAFLENQEEKEQEEQKELQDEQHLEEENQDEQDVEVDPEEQEIIEAQQFLENLANEEEEGHQDETSESEKTEEDKIDEEDITDKGCEHYSCNNQQYCHQCDKFYTCRFCHDEYEDAHFTKNHHYFDRFNVQKVKCLNCENIQEPKESGNKCNIVFGKYHCLKCNLYDDKGIAKKVYHGDECKICRVGGQENFFHCSICNACLPNSMRNLHEGADFSQNCSIGYEGFYGSKDTSQILKGKHIVHSKGFKGWMKNNYVCPVGRKSVLDSTTQSYVDAQIEQAIAATQMGEAGEMQVDVLCNECNGKWKANFHIVGYKCTHGSSYNTQRM